MADLCRLRSESGSSYGLGGLKTLIKGSPDGAERSWWCDRDLYLIWDEDVSSRHAANALGVCVVGDG